MENTQNYKLIDGTFEPLEALRALSGVMNSKINYHNLESFSNHIRFDTEISVSKKRTDELKSSLKDMKEVIEYAEKNNLKLKINSMIQVELIPKN
jgi:4-diphosphocytidyl-2C-methyl-D-erythritol kinase